MGFYVKDGPVSDELLIPFAGHKSMVNFGVEKGALTDACFPVFSAMPKLRYLLLDGNAGINGSGLSALQNCRLEMCIRDSFYAAPADLSESLFHIRRSLSCVSIAETFK